MIDTKINETKSESDKTKVNVASHKDGAVINKRDAMNAHTRRKWNSLKIFMYILISACALLVFWCRGACAVHLTPLEYSSLNFERSRHHYYPKVLKKAISPSSQHDFISQLRNHSPVTESKLILSHYQQQQKSSNIRQSSEHFELQESWKLRMRQKRRIQAHRREKHLLEQLVNKRSENQLIAMHNNFIPNSHSNLNIYYLKSFINEKILTQYNQRNIKKLNHKKNITLKNLQSRNEDLYKTLNEIMLNISVASNRNRRDSRYHHEQQPQMQQLQLSSQSVNINNAGNRSRRGRKRYCSARDAKTLAFEAPTVFEGKIKSMTTDRQANFSVTIEILRAYKQQASLTLPRQVRLQFAYKNVSECDIYREEFRHRGFVRDELEQGKIYFLFVKQISLGNFTILGQPIRKNSRTAKDIEIGVSEKYGEYRNIHLIEFLQFLSMQCLSVNPASVCLCGEDSLINTRTLKQSQYDGSCNFKSYRRVKFEEKWQMVFYFGITKRKKLAGRRFECVLAFNA